MRCFGRLIGLAMLMGAILVTPVRGQDENEAESEGLTEEQMEKLREILGETPGDPASGLDATHGPETVRIGGLAEINLPEGFRALGPRETDTFLQRCGNLPSDNVLAMILPEESADWFFVFQFEGSGYVPDDEKEDLDADALLENMRENQRITNQELTRRGLSPIEITGWAVPPRYNEETNNLEWALNMESVGRPLLNHDTRILGRRGTMNVTLVVDDVDQMNAVLPAYRDLLAGFAYTSGQRYSEYRKGDKLAEYGLTALITGGAAAVALKTGLLARFWKFILAGLVAIGAFLKKLFGGGSAPARPTRRPRGGAGTGGADA